MNVARIAEQVLCLRMAAEKMLRDHAAEHRARDAAEQAARHHAAESRSSARSRNAAERALDCAGLADFGARRRLRQCSGTVSGAGNGGAFCLRHLLAQLLQHFATLLRRKCGKRLGVRLLDRFRRRGFQHVAIARDRLFVGVARGLVHAWLRTAGPTKPIPNAHGVPVLRR